MWYYWLFVMIVVICNLFCGWVFIFKPLSVSLMINNALGNLLWQIIHLMPRTIYQLTLSKPVDTTAIPVFVCTVPRRIFRNSSACWLHDRGKITCWHPLCYRLPKFSGVIKTKEVCQLDHQRPSTFEVENAFELRYRY
jgi:hypothetical protein